MTTMDITPQELRDIEIREAWRGYHRDDVDELLERAAATIEHLEAENTQLRAGDGGAPAPLPTPAPAAPAPQITPTPAPTPLVRTPDTDVIQRTLVLAQKAADEAVAEAKTKAGQIVTDSEARAQQFVAEAEANARRIADAEKAKLEEDIARLTDARDTLTADVDALERFEQEYRERLRRAIHAELELLESTSAGASRPETHDLDVPISGPSWSASQEGAVTPVAAATPPPAPTPTVHIEAVPAYEAAEGEADWDPAPAGGWSEARADEPADAPAEAPAEAPAHAAADATEMALPVEHDYAASESLDDDAFFASLREAVRDDAPLGAGREDEAPYFDEDDTEEHRRLFKRRR
jgi:DivIVA domain-containing protein